MIWVYKAGLIAYAAGSVIALSDGRYDMAIWLLVAANLAAQFVIQEMNEGGKR